MGYSTQSIAVESVTPEKAAQFLSMNYRLNRPPRAYYVEFLAAEMAAGRFLSTAEIHVVYCNGEGNMVNGQHTCLAIMKFGKPVRVTVRKTITNEPGQVAMTYALGHDNGLRRSVADGIRSHGFEEQAGMTRAQTDALGTAIRFMRLGFGGKPTQNNKLLSQMISLSDLVEIMYDWAPYAKRYFWVIGERNSDFYRLAFKSGALSVALATTRYAPVEAARFWGDMAVPENLGWNHPVLVARRTLEASKSQRGARLNVTPAELARQMARCWKAYLENEEMKQAPKVMDAKANIRILRTPWTGRQPAAPWMPDDDAAPLLMPDITNEALPIAA